MDWSRYPADWKEISLTIRARDGHRCKFCRVPNGAIVKRLYGIPHNFAMPDFFNWCAAEKILRMALGVTWFEAGVGTVIVLTVAHLGAPLADGTPGNPHDKFDCRGENLAALCQRCHLMYDLDDHIINHARTRRAKRLASGQGELI